MLKQTVLRLIPTPVEQQLRRLKAKRDRRRAIRAVENFRAVQGRPHGLKGELVISLTSYPARFPTVDKTLKSLLMQTVRSDRIVLWVAHDEEAEVPESVRALSEYGVEVRTCDDLRSYNKIIPSLIAFPEAYIVTVDDDLYYQPNWLEMLVDGVVEGEKVVVCRRAHQPTRKGNAFGPYIDWAFDIVTDGSVKDMIFPTGCGGVLYPPGTLAPEVTEAEQIKALCPHADDIWLFVMELRAGSRFRQVGPGFAQTTWEGSQESTLMQRNLVDDGNDRQLEAVMERYNVQDALAERGEPG